MLTAPLVVLVVSAVTLLLVFVFSAVLGNTPGLLLPLSLLSNQQPQYYVYAVGLALVSSAATLLLLRRHSPARLPATATGLLAWYPSYRFPCYPPYPCYPCYPSYATCLVLMIRLFYFVAPLLFLPLSLASVLPRTRPRT